MLRNLPHIFVKSGPSFVVATSPLQMMTLNFKTSPYLYSSKSHVCDKSFKAPYMVFS